MSEYTSTTDEVRECYVRSTAVEAVALEPPWRKQAEEEFDRWLAQHEQQLREQIAQEIEAGNSTPDAWGYHWIEVDEAARIARKGRE